MKPRAAIKAVLLLAIFCLSGFTDRAWAQLGISDSYSVYKLHGNVQTNEGALATSYLPYSLVAQFGFSISTTLPATVFPPIGSSGFSMTFSKFMPSRKDFASQAALNASYPAGNFPFNYYRFNFTLPSGTTNLNLALPTVAYPNAPRVVNFVAAQSIDPAADFTLQWNAFTNGTTNDLIELQIANSRSNVFDSGGHPRQAEALNGLATGVTIPANTLQSGRSYVGRLIFAKVLSTNTTMSFGFSANCEQTDFILSTVGAGPMPRLVSVVPALGTTNVRRDLKIAMEFDRPMGSNVAWSLGGASSLTRAWSADQRVYTISSTNWFTNQTITVVLNFLTLEGFGDLDGNPILPRTLAASFTTSSNVGTNPLPPRLQAVSTPSNGVVQLQLSGGEAYRNYQLQASDDLVNWNTNAATPMLATNSDFTLTDPVPSATNRSYRVFVVP